MAPPVPTTMFKAFRRDRMFRPSSSSFEEEEGGGGGVGAENACTQEVPMTMNGNDCVAATNANNPGNTLERFLVLKIGIVCWSLAKDLQYIRYVSTAKSSQSFVSKERNLSVSSSVRPPVDDVRTKSSPLNNRVRVWSVVATRDSCLFPPRTSDFALTSTHSIHNHFLAHRLLDISKHCNHGHQIR